MRKYISIIVAIAIVISLIILFTWKEEFNSNFPINADKFGQFGTLLGSLLTAITIYLLFLQISEMKIDRKAASLPDLYPEESNFVTEDVEHRNFFSEEAKLTVPTFYKKMNGIQETSQTLNVKLHNIGMGAAKEITVNWEYDVTEVKKFIEGKYDSNIIGSDKEELDFIPAQGFSLLSLPYTFMKTCGTMVNSGYELFDEVPDKPNLKMSLQFKDIHDVLYTKKYIVSFECAFSAINVKFKTLK